MADYKVIFADNTRGTINADTLFEAAIHAAHLSQTTGRALVLLVSPIARKWHVSSEALEREIKRKTK